jgi:hypothetical protein
MKGLTVAVAFILTVCIVIGGAVVYPNVIGSAVTYNNEYVFGFFSYVLNSDGCRVDRRKNST